MSGLSLEVRSPNLKSVALTTLELTAPAASCSGLHPAMLSGNDSLF